MGSTGSISITDDIRVETVSHYVPEYSEPSNKSYTYRYHIKIINNTDETVTLISRTWVIIDSYGYTETIEGPGVVGQTPTILPGASFEYSSYCRLKTDFGTMEGSYTMEKKSGELFNVSIKRFYLAKNSDEPILAR